MMKLKNLPFVSLMLLAFVLLASSSGWAKVIHVPKDKPTIQSGIVAAATGDVVEAAPGTYFENVDFMGKAITVTSSGGPKLTTINGGQAGSVVSFAHGETTYSVLSGFTITNGLANFGNGYEGGGIVIQNSSPTIYANTITGNSAGNGGGIAVSFGSPLIYGNTITNNSQSGSGGTGGGGISLGGAGFAQVLYNNISNNSMSGADGGGISLDAAGTPVINNNLIASNTAYGMGGGVTMINDSDPTMVQNLIINNTAAIGGGVAMLVPSGSRGPFLVNNTIVGNNITQSPPGSAIYATGFESATEIVNNLLIGNNGKDAVYCDTTYSSQPPIIRNNDAYSGGGNAFGGGCAGYVGKFGNISAQPLFASLARNNFELLAGSPGIDAGLNSAPDLLPTDRAGRPRIVDGDSDGDYKPVIDMGAYEFQPVIVMPAALSFGMHPVGSHTSKPVTLTNQQKVSLMVGKIVTSGDFSQTNDCGGSLAAGANCTITVTFFPTGTGLRSGVLTVNDNDSNGPRKLALSGIGLQPTATPTKTPGQTPTGTPARTAAKTPTRTPAKTPTPTPTAIKAKIRLLVPGSAVAGSAGFSLTVFGLNFGPSSTVWWNGSARPTTFISSNRLRAAIKASDIAKIGMSLVSVSNPGSTGSLSAPSTFFTGASGGPGYAQVVLNQESRDLVYDPVRRVIYFSVPSTGGPITGNSVSVLDLTKAQITRSPFAGSEPDVLSISGDSSFLYAGLNGSASVKRFKLPSLATDIEISLGSSSSFGPYFALDLQVAPGYPHTTAISLGNMSVSPQAEGGIVIFDDKTPRPTRAGGFGSTNGGLFDSIQWGSVATQLYSANSEDTGFDFYTLSVNSSGVVLNHDYPNRFDSFRNRIHFDSGTKLIYSDDGHAINPSTGLPEGDFSSSGAMVPDSSIGRAFFATGSPIMLQSFDIRRFTPISSITLSGVSGTPLRIIRWGQNGLVFNTDSGQVCLIGGNFVD